MIAIKTVNGQIFLENPHKYWRHFDFAKKGKTSDLATQYWQEIEQNINS